MDCDVGPEVDVLAAVPVDKPAFRVPVSVSMAGVPIDPGGAAVAEGAGHSRTYVVCPPSESSEAIRVGKSTETPPCPFGTTEITAVCAAAAPLLADLPTEDAKILEVPVTVKGATVDAVVEMA